MLQTTLAADGGPLLLLLFVAAAQQDVSGEISIKNTPIKPQQRRLREHETTA